ncbi:unnamed protein product [Effrenium voratum]|nr:unnamed protein product [Effrenium voratum]
MQREIESLLDLKQVVSSAFLRDKVLLGELFQKAGRKELEFLVNSGLSFGFFLGILQMLLWICFPNNWVLPVGGALVGYITNWVAIKLIFDPVEPVQVGPFTFQGLFEKRQVEVSEEFSQFLAERVLTSQRLIGEIANGANNEKYRALVRRAVPGVVPDHVVTAAANSLKKVALEPANHPVHVYVDKELRLQETLFKRLCKLTSPEFENLLHPVFQEDELTLIVAGGVLGAAAGFLQMTCGWGGPSSEGAVAAALKLSASAGAGAAATKAALMVPPQLLRWVGRSLQRLWRPRSPALRERRGKKKYAHDHEIAALKNLLPGDNVEKNSENRSLKTNRLFPTANKPDPMPQNLAFLFTKITPEQMMYFGWHMWNVLTAIFVSQVLMVCAYCAALATFPEHWWTCTLCFGIPFSYIAIQNIYIDHDVMHGFRCTSGRNSSPTPLRISFPALGGVRA